MEAKETTRLFDAQSGQKEIIFDNNYNKACLGIGVSVTSGKITAQGRISETDSLHELTFVNYRSGEITETAEDGIFTVLGSEMLHSIVFTGDNADAYAKFLF